MIIIIFNYIACASLNSPFSPLPDSSDSIADAAGSRRRADQIQLPPDLIAISQEVKVKNICPAIGFALGTVESTTRVLNPEQRERTSYNVLNLLSLACTDKKDDTGNRQFLRGFIVGALSESEVATVMRRVETTAMCQTAQKDIFLCRRKTRRTMIPRKRQQR